MMWQQGLSQWSCLDWKQAVDGETCLHAPLLRRLLAKMTFIDSFKCVHV